MAGFIDGFLKRLLDNRLYWNVIEGPLYNIFIYRVLDGAYDDFFRTLAIPARAHILDVGSGAGQATLRLAMQRPDASIHGIDFAFTQVRLAHLLRRHRKVPNIEFKVGDVMNLPFHDGAFDVVISLASLKHWQDATGAFAEIRRVLRSNGIAYIIECDGDTPRDEIEALAERATGFSPLKRAIAWYQEHVVFGQSYSKKEVLTLAHDAGFKDIHIKRMDELPFLSLVLRKERKVLVNCHYVKEDA